MSYADTKVGASIGAEVHIPGFQACPDTEVAALCDIKQELAEGRVRMKELIAEGYLGQLFHVDAILLSQSQGRWVALPLSEAKG